MDTNTTNIYQPPTLINIGNFAEQTLGPCIAEVRDHCSFIPTF